MPQLHDDHNHAADKILVTTILTREERIEGLTVKENNKTIFETAYHNHFESEITFMNNVKKEKKKSNQAETEVENDLGEINKNKPS